MSGSRSLSPRARLAWVVELALTLAASAVFVLLWGTVAVAALTDGELLADAWAWLTGLDTIPALVAWVAILPVGLFLWAWQANLEPLFMGLVLVGLVMWTGIAWSGLVRVLLRRGRP